MSPRATRTLPTVEPILLTPQGEPFDDPAWLFEPKYDGFRGLLHITPTGAPFTSKRGLPLKRFADSNSNRLNKRAWLSTHRRPP